MTAPNDTTDYAAIKSPASLFEGPGAFEGTGAYSGREIIRRLERWQAAHPDLGAQLAESVASLLDEQNCEVFEARAIVEDLLIDMVGAIERIEVGEPDAVVTLDRETLIGKLEAIRDLRHRPPAPPTAQSVQATLHEGDPRPPGAGF